MTALFTRQDTSISVPVVPILSRPGPSTVVVVGRVMVRVLSGADGGGVGQGVPGQGAGVGGGDVDGGAGDDGPAERGPCAVDQRADGGQRRAGAGVTGEREE